MGKEQLQQSAIGEREDWGCGAAFAEEQMEIFGRTCDGNRVCEKVGGAEMPNHPIKSECEALPTNPEASLTISPPFHV